MPEPDGARLGVCSQALGRQLLHCVLGRSLCPASPPTGAKGCPVLPPNGDTQTDGCPQVDGSRASEAPGPCVRLWWKGAPCPPARPKTATTAAHAFPEKQKRTARGLA